MVDCLLHALNQGMIWMAEDGLWDWRYILDHKEARASLMDELHDNSDNYEEVGDEEAVEMPCFNLNDLAEEPRLDWASYTDHFRGSGLHLGPLEIRAFAMLTGIQVRVYSDLIPRPESMCTARETLTCRRFT